MIAARRLLIFDPSGFRPLAALRSVAAVAILLALALVAGHPVWGLIAAAGAFPVGFGAFHTFTRFRPAPMLLAAFGMGASAALGTLVGHAVWATMAAAILWGFGSGLMAALGPAAWWFSLQWTVALLIAAAYPGWGAAAAERGLVVLAGGLLQAGTVIVLWHFEGRSLLRAAAPEPAAGLRSALRTLSRQFTWRSRVFRHALRLAVALAAASWLYRLLDFQNGYWLPVTALIVLQPALSDTMERAVARAGGTLVASVLATLFVALMRPHALVLASLAAACAWTSYAVLRVNYALFAVALTAYVVFLLALGGVPEIAIAGHRALATVLGGATALIVHLATRRVT